MRNHALLAACVLSLASFGCAFKGDIRPSTIVEAVEHPLPLSTKLIIPSRIKIAVREERTEGMRCLQMRELVNNEIVRTSRKFGTQIRGTEQYNLGEKGLAELAKSATYTQASKVVSSCQTTYAAPEVYTLLQHRSRLTSILARSVEGYLGSEKNLAVINKNFDPSNARFIVSVATTEVIPNLGAQEGGQDKTLSTLGYLTSISTPYVGMAASSLGPIGALLQGFDIITGIPTSWNSGQQVGQVVADVKLLDSSSSEIIAAFNERASYGVEYASVGDEQFVTGGFSSGQCKLSMKTLEVATEEVSRQVAEKVLDKLKETLSR